jgi:hypothetical protein
MQNVGVARFQQVNSLETKNYYRAFKKLSMLPKSKQAQEGCATGGKARRNRDGRCGKSNYQADN